MLTHSDRVHRMMWAIYTYWIKQLCSHAKEHIPDIKTQFEVEQIDAPYLIIANHYSWLDILIIYMVMTPKAPSFVFVMKRSLVKIPMIGIICWGLGHPMIKKRKRRINGKLENHLVLETAAKEANRHQYGMMIFPEGTRYNIHQKLPRTKYQNLLNPKNGGFDILYENLKPTCVLDITLSYEKKQHTILDFLLARLGSVSVHVQQITQPVSETGAWLHGRWQLKDERLNQMKSLHQASDQSL